MRINRGDAHRSEADVPEETECETAAEQLLGDVAPADERRREWIVNVQKKFGADPHYHVSLSPCFSRQSLYPYIYLHRRHVFKPSMARQGPDICFDGVCRMFFVAGNA